MRKTLTSARGFKLKDGTILSCESKWGYYVGILKHNRTIPVFKTLALKDGLDDWWDITDWSLYAIATESEFVLWKLEHSA